MLKVTSECNLPVQLGLRLNALDQDALVSELGRLGGEISGESRAKLCIV